MSFGDFVQETASGIGTSTTINLLGATAGAGFVRFRDRHANGETVVFTIAGTLADATFGRECCESPLSYGTPDTLTRNVISNSAGNTTRLNFTGAVSVYEWPPGERLITLNSDSTLVLDAAGGTWSSFNAGKQLLVSGSGNNPGIAIAANGGTNLFGIFNDTGTLRIAAMPAYADSVTAPDHILTLSSSSITLGKATTVSGVLTLSANLAATTATFSGALNGTSGSFSGAVGGASLSISGAAGITGLATVGSLTCVGSATIGGDFAPHGGIVAIENNGNFYLQNSGGNPTLNFASSVYVTYGSSILSINTPGAMGITASSIVVTGNVDFPTGLITMGGSQLIPFGGGINYSNSGSPPYSALSPSNYSATLAAASNVVANQFFAASDEDLKEGIESLSYEEAMGWLHAVHPKKYFKQGVPEWGFLAQDWIRSGLGYLIGLVPNKDMPERHYPDFPDEWKKVDAGFSLMMDRTNPVAALTVIVKEMTAEFSRMKQDLSDARDCITALRSAS